MRLHRVVRVWSGDMIRSGLRLAGHNRWSKVKHAKAVVDAQRGAAVQKLTTRIAAAVKQDGADPSQNLALAACLAEAKRLQVPKETILTAVSRGNGLGSSENMQDIEYEISAFKGTLAVIVCCSTQNKNRMVKQIRHVCRQHDAVLSSVRHYFYRCGKLQVMLDGMLGDKQLAHDKLLDMAIEAGAEDVVLLQDESSEIMAELTCKPEQIKQVAKHLQQCKGVTVTSLDVVYTAVQGHGEKQMMEPAADVSLFLKDLESLQDVQHIYHCTR